MTDETTAKWGLVEQNHVACHRFYTLPKIHKTLDHPPGRPIVSGINGPTEKVSKLVDFWLQDIVTKLPSHIKDSTHMLHHIEEWNTTIGPFDDNTKLLTIDVKALYTNIPHDDMLTSLSHFLQKLDRTNSSIPPTSTVIKLAKHVLENNFFTFEGQCYQQVFGTAMGTPMAPSVANLFMGWLEDQLLDNSPVPIQINTWKRFFDDIFFAVE